MKHDMKMFFTSIIIGFACSQLPAQSDDKKLQPVEDNLLIEDSLVSAWRKNILPIIVNKIHPRYIVALLVVGNSDLDTFAIEKVPIISDDPLVVIQPKDIIVWRINTKSTDSVRRSINRETQNIVQIAWKLVNEAKQGAQNYRLALDGNEEWLLACRPVDTNGLFSTAPLQLAVAINPEPTSLIAKFHAELVKIIGRRTPDREKK